MDLNLALALSFSPLKIFLIVLQHFGEFELLCCDYLSLVDVASHYDLITTYLKHQKTESTSRFYFLTSIAVQWLSINLPLY